MNSSNALRKMPFYQRLSTIIVVISPLLAMYGIGVSTITILDVAILLCFVLQIATNGIVILRIGGTQKQLIYIIMLVFINMLYSAALMSLNASSILLRTARFIWYLLFVISNLDDSVFCVRFGLKVYEVFAVFTSVFLILQFFLLYGFGYSLKGYVSFLPLMREELNSFTSSLYASSYARPRSLFGEPSQFGIYATGYLGISYFYGLSERFRFEKWIIMLAMLLSASSTAVLGLAMLLGFYTVKLLKKKKVFGLVILFGLVIGLVFLFVPTGFLGDRITLALQRMPSSFSNRLGGFAEYLARAKEFSPFQLFFGIGMNTANMTVWYSGTAKILLYWGILGGIYYVIINAFCLIRMQDSQRDYYLVFFILSLFSEIVVSNWLILFLPFALRDLSAYNPKAECVVDEMILAQ